MSTFNGLVSEFPDIRIDFFRRHVDAEPPLACFLSHVHSDHLAGLESLRSPFVYCSAATREILLRLERYPCRINYAKGILEARQQTYKHLAKVLKSLPLETPTTIELHPGREIQVTLFDANHCLGAVMFLIEGDGRAVLYTGDIRSEKWFVNSLARNPVLVEYTAGLKTLDKIYLDTSFINNVAFQSKAEGIAELLRKVSQYPKETVFHFQAWTYGYEEVWVALSKALKSPVHVDDYKLRIYSSLRGRSSENKFGGDIHMTPESPALTGYMCGNAPHPGCLTADENVRLHSCEKGNMCEAARRPSTVIIQPIIAHMPNGEDLAEVGVGGGGDDLEREVELDFLEEGLEALVEFICSAEILTPEDRDALKSYLAQETSNGRSVSLDIDHASLKEHESVQEAIQVLMGKLQKTAKQQVAETNMQGGTLPRKIRFPYSRHSSYPELCDLVEAFRPKDVWPCTVNPQHWIRDGVSIESLFGRFCSGDVFEHNQIMQVLLDEQAAVQLALQMESQLSTDSGTRLESSPMIPSASNSQEGRHDTVSEQSEFIPVSQRLVGPLRDTQDIVFAALNEGSMDHSDLRSPTPTPAPTPASTVLKRGFEDYASQSDDHESQATNRSFAGERNERHSLARQEAYFKMLDNATSDTWSSIALISTNDEYTVPEKEL